MEGARHDQAVTMLTGLERFVRLVAERETLVARGSGGPAPQASSPKVLGVSSPKPYTGIYSAPSQMAQRPLFASSPPTAAPRKSPPSNIQVK